MASLVRFVPTRILDAMRRKIFRFPAPGSRAATPARQGATR